MTSKSASTTRRAPPATRPTAKAEAGSRPPTTVSDAVSAVAGLGGTSTNVFPSPGSPSVARIGGSGTILSFARARSLQRTVGNQATRAVLSIEDASKPGTRVASPAPTNVHSSAERPAPSGSAVQRAFGDFFRSNTTIANRKIEKASTILSSTIDLYQTVNSGRERMRTALKTREWDALGAEATLSFEALATVDRQVQAYELFRDSSQKNVTKSIDCISKKDDKVAVAFADDAKLSAKKAVESMGRADDAFRTQRLQQLIVVDGPSAGVILGDGPTEEKSPAKVQGPNTQETVQNLYKANSLISTGGSVSDNAGADLLTAGQKAAGMSVAGAALGSANAVYKFKDIANPAALETANSSVSSLSGLVDLYGSVKREWNNPNARNKLNVTSGLAQQGKSALEITQAWIEKTPAVADAIPIIGAIVAGLKIVSAAKSTWDAWNAWDYFRTEKRKIKHALGVEKGTGLWNSIKNVFGGGNPSGQEKAQEASESDNKDLKMLASTYEHNKELQYNKAKNIRRGILNITTNGMIIVGEITKLTGVGLAAGAAISLAGKVTSAGASLYRTVKQAKNNFLGNDKSTENKMMRYRAIANNVFEKIRAASSIQTLLPEGTDAVPEAVAVERETEAIGYPLGTMARAKDRATLDNEFIETLKQRQ